MARAAIASNRSASHAHDMVVTATHETECERARLTAFFSGIFPLPAMAGEMTFGCDSEMCLRWYALQIMQPRSLNCSASPAFCNFKSSSSRQFSISRIKSGREYGSAWLVIRTDIDGSKDKTSLGMCGLLLSLHLLALVKRRVVQDPSPDPIAVNPDCYLD